MSGAAQRSAKGADPITREIAERMARQSGLSLEDWLDSLRALDARQPDDPDGDSTALAGAAYVETPRRGEAAPARYEAPDHPADEVVRMTQAIERLSQRIETAEDRATSALSVVENTMRGTIHRLDGDEREQVAVAARFEGVAQDLGAEQSRISERLRRIENEAHGPRSVEALRSLEAALGKVAAHLYEGEGRTRDAIAEVSARVDLLHAEDGRSATLAEAVVGRIGARLEEAEGRTGEALRQLQSSFAALDARIASVEGEIAGGGVEMRLESLADQLSARLESARAEMDARLRSTAEGRIDQIERAMSQMADHVQTAERRSAEAIERMGRELVEMAGALTRRVQVSETRGAEAIEQVGGEVARIAQAVETKLGRADTIHAQALEKLGVEIARISERLAERIANSDRRAALAIDEVGEQVARTSERFSQRQERVSEDLAERIRMSEERTARVLEEARERLEKLAAARQAEEAARLAAQVEPEDTEERIFGDDPFAGFQPPPPSPALFAPTPPASPEPAAAPAFTQEDLDAAESFSPAPVVSDVAEEASFGQRPSANLSFPSVGASEEAAATWEMIQRARPAVATAEPAISGPRVARPAAASSEGGGLFSHRFTRSSRGPGAGNIALGVGMAAAVGLALGGFWVLEGAPKPALPPALADLMGGKAASAPPPGAAAGTAPSLPQEAVALAPTPITGSAGGVARTAAPSADLAGRYASAVAQIDLNHAQGVDSLRRVANLGYAPAQFYLAKLYETGAGGLAKDASEARRWTERAAAGGERKAMHNLALYYFEGTGGPKNSATAADWFRRAAQLGLADSQFNLGRLYEQGLGVPRNPAEAYKWYTIAGRSGDAESRAGAARVKALLSAEARGAAERSATAFRTPSDGPALATAQTASGDLVTAQKGLLALGYYQGPADGASSPALKLALSAYQQDQGLPATGAPDTTTMAKLSALTR